MTSVGRIFAVFAVNTAYILAENKKGIDRVCLAVHEQVCRVKVDADVIGSYIFDGAEKRYGRFLTGLEKEILTVRFENFAYVTQAGDDLMIFRGAGIFGQESDVRNYVCDPELECKVSALEYSVHSCVSVFARNKSESKRTVVEVPDAGIAPTRPKCGYGKIIVCQSFFDFFDIFVRQKRLVPAVELTIVNSEFFYIGDLFLNIGTERGHNSNFHDIIPFIYKNIKIPYDV